jgi:hypothetical protein
VQTFAERGCHVVSVTDPYGRILGFLDRTLLLLLLLMTSDRLCGLVVRGLGYRSSGPASVPGVTILSWELVGLEWSPLNPVSTTEELLRWNSSSSGLEYRKYCCRDPLRWPRNTLYLQKLALTSPTRGGRSVGRVRSRTKATEFVFVLLLMTLQYTVGRGISPLQGLYLHTGQNKHRMKIHIYPCIVWDSNPWSQHLSEWRQFMP